MKKHPKPMRSQLGPAIRLLALLTLITGIFYPLAVTGLAQLFFPKEANGSLIIVDGEAVGSEQIGQPFSEPGYFWSRPSMTEPFPYNAAASAGSNLAPTYSVLLELVTERVEALQEADPDSADPVPVDLVAASGSGLDPHISVAAARYQVPRVARIRDLEEAVIYELVDQFTEPRQFGILGEPRVNVLRLNLALDALQSSGQ